MEQNEAITKVMAIIGPYSKKGAVLEGLPTSTRILEDLGVNSARLVDIILDFEDKFGITIDDESADKVRTLGDAVDLVVRKTLH